MKKYYTIVLILLIELFSSYGYGQKSVVYNTIETQNVMYYSVEEIVNLKFGGTKTTYTVSDLSLISKADLGPNNIRIITPIYKNENFTKKNYYIETKNLNPDSGSQQRTTLTEIKIDSKKIDIPENPQIEKEALALVIKNIIVKEPVVEIAKPVKMIKSITVVKPAETSKIVENVNIAKPREKVDHININVMDIYERVADKGYQSIFMFKELANYFYFNKQMEKAVKWYEELFAMTNDLAPEYYFRFGDALRKTGKTQRGEELVEKFNQLTE